MRAVGLNACQGRKPPAAVPSPQPLPGRSPLRQQAQHPVARGIAQGRAAGCLLPAEAGMAGWRRCSALAAVHLMGWQHRQVHGRTVSACLMLKQDCAMRVQLLARPSTPIAHLRGGPSSSAAGAAAPAAAQLRAAKPAAAPAAAVPPLADVAAYHVPAIAAPTLPVQCAAGERSPGASGEACRPPDPSRSSVHRLSRCGWSLRLWSDRALEGALPEVLPPPTRKPSHFD